MKKDAIVTGRPHSGFNRSKGIGRAGDKLELGLRKDAVLRLGRLVFRIVEGFGDRVGYCEAVARDNGTRIGQR